MAIYPSIYNGPPNNYSVSSAKKRYIAIHNTANDASAENEASYAKRRTDSVSSHYYVDSNSIIQSLDTKHKAWHAGSGTGNTYAISYEITGTNAKSRDWWLNNVAWDLLAKQIATDMKLWGISNKRLSISQMNDGYSSGIVTHNDMRLAWGGTTHTDPGSNFPMDHLIAKVNQYLTGAVQEEDDMFEQADRDRDTATTWRALGVLENRPEIRYTINGVERVEKNGLYAENQIVKAELTALKATLASVAADLAAIKAGTGSGTVPSETCTCLTLEDIEMAVKQALREGTE